MNRKDAEAERLVHGLWPISAPNEQTTYARQGNSCLRQRIQNFAKFYHQKLTSYKMRKQRTKIATYFRMT